MIDGYVAAEASLHCVQLISSKGFGVVHKLGHNLLELVEEVEHLSASPALSVLIELKRVKPGTIRCLQHHGSVVMMMIYFIPPLEWQKHAARTGHVLYS